MSQSVEYLLWSLTVVAVIAAVGVVLWNRGGRSRTPDVLPADWNLAPRPVFSTDERRVYRQLREALPHHIILSKLPLVRFCHPNDPQQIRYWYRLLGTTHVSFAVCSINGRVLATVDLENDRGESDRRKHIKQSVMAACRIRYLRCPVDQLPSVAELQMLVPHSNVVRGPQAATADAAASAEARQSARRPSRRALWRESSYFGDSFFAQDKRDDTQSSGFAPSVSGSEVPTPSHKPSDDPHRFRGALPDDVAGVVIDPPTDEGKPGPERG